MKFIWVENANATMPDFLPPLVARYQALGFTAIITTSPGVDYLPVFDAFSGNVFGSFKLVNAFRDQDPIDYQPAWDHIVNTVAAYVQNQQAKLAVTGITAGSVPVILEAETLLVMRYWYANDLPSALAGLKYGLARLAALDAVYTFYPALMEDLGIPGFHYRCKALLAAIRHVMPGVRFSDQEYAYQPPNATWSDWAASERTLLQPKGGLSLVYTDTWNRQGHRGWPAEYIPDLLDKMDTLRRNPALYPGAAEAELAAPLEFLEA